MFFKENINRQNATNELRWGDALKDFSEYMETVPRGAKTAKIQELKGLMRRHPIDHERGPPADTILKLLVCGDRQTPEPKIKIEIRRPLKDCARQKKGGGAQPSAGEISTDRLSYR